MVLFKGALFTQCNVLLKLAQDWSLGSDKIFELLLLPLPLAVKILSLVHDNLFKTLKFIQKYLKTIDLMQGFVTKYSKPFIGERQITKKVEELEDVIRLALAGPRPQHSTLISWQLLIVEIVQGKD